MRNFLLLLLCVTTMASWAQTDPQAKADLDKAISEIRAMEAFEIAFSVNLLNESAGVNEKFEGSGIVQGEMYSLDVMNYHQICDGKTVYMVDKEFMEATISNLADADNMLSINSMLSLYESGMKIAYGNEVSQDGKKVQLYELVPVDGSDKSFHRIEMAFDQKTMELVGLTQYEKNGSLVKTKVKTLKETEAKSVSYYTLDHHYKKSDLEDISDFR